jgi:4-diphosphocytidyl-2-C-methyl-D-erythritol kinase
VSERAAKSFSIEHASVDQVDALCAIERKAVQLFRGHAAWPVYAAMPVPPEKLLQAIERGRVWIARMAGDEPVGFVWLEEGAAVDVVDLIELDVLPEYGQRGIGTALLDHACAWAAAAGYRRIDLGTLADVPWNAPFYARRGFQVQDKHAPAFAQALRLDQDNGFADHLRVFMSRPLPAPAHDEWTAWPAPAKLNLFLRIVGRRDDGYHELQTVFRLLDWGDGIRLRVRDDGEIHRLTEVPGVPEASDLVVRAARLLQSHAGAGKGADIEVDKRIPMGGGLGGGSSDAATVLVGLNYLWNLALSENALAELGRQLGADVPVFVRGRSAWAEGIGEQLTPLPMPRRYYVVVDPQEQVPTAALFQASELTRNAPRATISSFASGETTENAFAPVVRARHPRVAAALDWLDGFGKARLSGSGGCVFLEAKSFHRAMAIARQCPAAFTVRVTAGVDVSPLQLALARHRDRQ